jgi:hypothetical protein
MTQIHLNHTVLVIGDEDTAGRAELLAEKAAEHGARIAETFAFPQGAAAVHDDLTDVEAVVAVLSRAIATRRDVWCPFPLQDLCREQHIRRLSLALQRHGLNLLMGQELSPCPVEGGYSEVDVALRNEVRAVDDLDNAALACAASQSLIAEIQEALDAARPAERVCRGERIYTTREAAGLLGKSPNWLYAALRHKLFHYSDGSPIEPLRVGSKGRRRYTGSMLRAMAKSCLRHGVLDKRDVERVLAELSGTERP